MRSSSLSSKLCIQGGFCLRKGVLWALYCLKYYFSGSRRSLHRQLSELSDLLDRRCIPMELIRAKQLSSTTTLPIRGVFLLVIWCYVQEWRPWLIGISVLHRCVHQLEFSWDTVFLVLFLHAWRIFIIIMTSCWKLLFHLLEVEFRLWGVDRFAENVHFLLKKLVYFRDLAVFKQKKRDFSPLEDTYFIGVRFLDLERFFLHVEVVSEWYVFAEGEFFHCFFLFYCKLL